MSNVIKRTTLIVRNIEQSKRWYEDVFGLTVWMDTEVTLSGMGMAAGEEGDVTRLIILQCEDPTIGMIGLLQWIDPPMPAPDEIPTSVTYGNPIFVVASDDVQRIHERANGHGTHIHMAPKEWSIRGQNGKTKHFLGISLFDPDGYFYEVNQLLRETD